MKEFSHDLKQYGLKIAITNLLINFVKWFAGAKQIILRYKK